MTATGAPVSGIALGSFHLVAPLASGAMASVWRGVHRPTSLPVAVKVMTAEMARAPSYVLAFRNEVEAVARLDHAGIVRVYDFGALPPEVETASGGAFLAGSPYLVMELAHGGSLDKGGRPGDWKSLRALLLVLLDALAHAHARGVVHRDLKPGNVLCERRASGGPGYLLTDFGLAHALGEDAPRLGNALATSGTPPYMAPEQFSGEWREQGPWTDLYALGCLVYALATGVPPFAYDDLQQLAMAHVLESPPRMRPTFPVPYGLESWARALLAKRTHDRFQHAADAAWALGQLDDRSMPSAIHPPATPRHELATTPFGTMPVMPEVVAAAQQLADREPSSTLIDRHPPPLPDHWRASEIERTDAPLRGAGIGIFGLRTIPLVDREVERDAVWKALGDVHKTGKPRVVVLGGPAGSGKSRVARWVAERADEVGGAVVLRATHSAQGSKHDGLMAMFARHLRCQELEADLLRERLTRVLTTLGEPDPALAGAVADLLLGRSAEVTQLVDGVAAKGAERRRVLLHLFDLLGTERPLVVLFDDVQWGLEALRLAHQLLLTLDPMPVLVLCTVRDEALVQGSLEHRQIDAILEHPHASALEVQKLGTADHHRLCEQLLGLSGDLCDRVAARTQGNPLFAVQLVADWVARGALASGEAGFELRAGAGQTLPDDIHELCAARIARALGQRPETDLRALEVAALLGAEVDEVEWRSVCRQAGTLPSPGLLADLSRQGLLEPALASWRFTHGVLRESLERMAKAGGRSEEQHRVIADVLRGSYPQRTAELSARIGRHLAAGGLLHDAHAPLLQAARLLRVESDQTRAAQLVDEARALLDRLDVGPDDPRRCEGDLVSAAMQLDTGQLAGAEALALYVADQARAREWPAIAARAALVSAGVAVKLGDYDGAVNRCVGALGTLKAYGDRRGEYEARAELANAYYYQGNHDYAHDAYQANLVLAEDLGDEVAVAEARWGLGYVDLWRGRYEPAREHFEAMRAILARRGAAYRLADCYNALGEAARLSGRLAEAEQLYREALRLAEVYGTAGGIIGRVNLVLVRVAMGDIAACCEMLPDVIVECENLGQLAPIVGALAVTLTVRAHMPIDSEVPGVPTWDETIVRLERLLSESRLRDGDCALSLTHAAEAMHARGDARRAAAAARLGCSVWQALGREDRVAALAVLAQGAT
jgi:eukaryotic-like serine/threonine-protein kinase